METFLNFLVEHGYAVVFAWVALDQAGLPLPAVPILLGAGALASAGTLSLPVVVALAALASVPIDWIWFELGRRRGGRVLNLLCAISLEPDYCVRNTEAMFSRLGVASLLIAKFVPGLQTIAPPMAGMTGMSLGFFLLLDTAGALIWAGLIAGIGFVFGDQLTSMAEQFAELGTLAGIIARSLGDDLPGIPLSRRQQQAVRDHFSLAQTKDRYQEAYAFVLRGTIKR